MHFYFVCNMNKIGRVFVIYIIVLATTEADETKSHYRTSTTTTKWKQPTTSRWREPITASSSKRSANSNSWKNPTASDWHQPTKESPNRISSQASIDHGTVAFASFSGSDSRNGRRSSMDGVKIFPPVDSSMVKTDDKGNFIFKSVNGKMPMPITITKQGDGVSGTIRIMPGSVSVSSSSSSKSGPATAMASLNPWTTSYMKPITNDIYFPSFPSIPDPIFSSRIPGSSYNTRFPDPFSYMRIPEATIPTIRDPWSNKNSYRQSQRKHDMFQPSWYYPSFSPYFNYW